MALAEEVLDSEMKKKMLFYPSSHQPLTLKEANNMFCELRFVPLVVIGLIVLERLAKGNYITADFFVSLCFHTIFISTELIIRLTD